MLCDNIGGTLSDAGVEWKNCVGIDLDNTAVNVGKRNPIMTQVLGKNNKIHVNGCPCHIFFFFFYLGFLSQPFTNHRTAREERGHFFNSSLPLIIIINLFIVDDKNTVKSISISTHVALNTWLI